jgi:hypothetical protein
MKVQKESQIRTTVRVCEYTEADLYIMLANMPTYHRARKIIQLAQVGLLVEQGKIAGTPIPSQYMAPPQMPSAISALPVKATLEAKEEVHYPGAGNTNVNFESVFGPME